MRCDPKKRALRPGALFCLTAEFLGLPAITTAATAATTASLTTTVAVAESAGPSLLRSGFVHRKVTAVEIRAIESLNGSLSLFRGSHFDKTKAAGTPRELVGNYPGRLNGPVRRKDF